MLCVERPLRLPTLHWDILYYLMPFLASKADLSRLMRTCSTLHKLGIPMLAHDCSFRVPLAIGHLVSFVLFMVKDPLRPLLTQALRIPRLPLQYFSDNPSVGQLIVIGLFQTIALALNLKVLHICDFEELVNMTENVPPIFLLKPNLKVVDFEGVGRRGDSMLQRLDRSVDTMNLTYLANPDFPAMHFLKTPPAFQQNLQNIVLHDVPESTSFRGLRCPELRSLVIRGAHLYNLVLTDVVYAFPNLRTLSWSTTQELLANPDIDREVLIKYATPDRWTSLEELCCGLDISWPYSLVFSGPVKYRRSAVLLGDADLYYFYTLLDDIRPTHLSLLVDGSSIEYAQLFAPPSRADVTHLNINFLDMRTNRGYMDDIGCG